MTQLTELDYEAIENAVMATARGRWFLSEHKKRHSGTGTPEILDAIARLEKVITSINSGEPAQTAPAPQPPQVAAPTFAPAIVDTPAAPEQKSLSEENLQFFSNDEDLFAEDTSSFLTGTIEPENPVETAEPAPEKVEVSTEQQQAPAPAGDRFKVFKAAPADTQNDAQDEMSVSVDNADSSDVPDPTMQPTTEEQDRIVVIRSSAGDDIDIPLADEFADAAESEKPVTATN